MGAVFCQARELRRNKDDGCVLGKDPSWSVQWRIQVSVITNKKHIHRTLIDIPKLRDEWLPKNSLRMSYPRKESLKLNLVRK